MMRRLLLCALLLAAAGADAHETLIGMLQIREVQPGSFLATWNFQSDRGIPPPTAVFPAHCSYENPPTTAIT